MSAKVNPSPLFHAHGQNGTPLVGGKVFTYEAGTTTPKATFQDAVGNAANTNPVILNARGEAAIYWGAGLYKVRLEDANGVLIYEVDNVGPQVADTPSKDMNLIANGSFEADADGNSLPDGWTVTAYPGGSIDLDRYDPGLNPIPDNQDGASALRLVHPGGVGNGGGYVESGSTEVAGGSEYFVSFAIKSDLAGMHNKVEVRWFGADKGLLSVSAPFDDSATNPIVWTHLNYPVTAPAGARYGTVRLYGGVNDNSTAGTVRFDDVRLARVENNYLRSDVADTVSRNLALENSVALQGKTVAGSPQNLANVDSADQAVFGTVTLPQKLHSSVDPQVKVAAGAYQNIWHSGNDGPGSGLDADTVDSLQATDFLRANLEDTRVVPFNLASASPTLRLLETNAGPDESIWDMTATASSFQMRARNDALNTASPFLTVARTGPNVGAVNLMGTAVNINGQTVYHTGNLNPNEALGVGQIWTDQSAGRAFATSYQNTTVRPISVAVTVLSTQPSLVLEASTDGINWVIIGANHDGFNASQSVTGIIPSGHYYKVSGSGTATWAELR